MKSGKQPKESRYLCDGNNMLGNLTPTLPWLLNSLTQENREVARWHGGGGA